MKRRGRKKKRNKVTEFIITELNGVILVILAILGIGRFGLVGETISGVAFYLMGQIGLLFLISLILFGLHLIFRARWPKMFHQRMVGAYLIVISIMILLQLDYINTQSITRAEILNNTLNNFSIYVDDITAVRGGGVIGGLLTTVFFQLFAEIGTKIIIGFNFFVGFLLLTDIPLSKLIKWLSSKIKFKKPMPKAKKITNDEIKIVEDSYEEDHKIIVSSVEELNSITQEATKSKNDAAASLVINKAEVVKPVAQSEPEININNPGYKLPPITLLNQPSYDNFEHDKEEITKNGRLLEQVLTDFGIKGRVVAANIGPTITQYEMELSAGTKVTKVTSIHREISLMLAAKDVRIQAPIPGKNTIGIEIPNSIAQSVTMREILERIPKDLNSNKLLVPLGKDVMGKPIYAEINNTPHLLVAGATGSGKSVCINTIITSILMRSKPSEVRMLMVDPKKVELSVYSGIPHLLAPVVTDPKRASIALHKIVEEMENRYDLFNDSGTKNIAGYNKYIDKKNESLSPEDKINHLPYIVVIVDELADLMLVAAKDVEDSIMRITQMARAAGIHLIIATQRPSTDIITGVIKANIPSRISFAVSSSIDSRTILDASGAEKLLGKGDMLFLPMGENTSVRVQGAFISESEVKRVVDYTISQQKANYDEKMTKLEEPKGETFVDENDYEDPMYDEIVEFVLANQKASASLLQRRFRLGYNRAARVIDLLEERGIIGPANGSKPRDVLVELEESDR